jgi:hypothetical protein
LGALEECEHALGATPYPGTIPEFWRLS